MQILGVILSVTQGLVLAYCTRAVNRPLTIFIHEAGHAFAGWSVGLKLKSFHVGANGGQCIFHEDALAHKLTNKPAHIAWIVAGGSLANAGAAVLFFQTALLLYRSTIAPGLSVLVICLCVLGLTNARVASFLFFHRNHLDSDGYNLGLAWRMWRTKKGTPAKSKGN